MPDITHQVSSRLTDLESRISFQEQTIDQLDEQVQKLNNLVDLLQHEITDLGERMLEKNKAGQELSVNVTENLPPHY
jgi:SlyX protein